MTEYEYKISDHDPRSVLVRRRNPHAGRPSLWTLYLLCDSEDDAERVLNLLQQPQTEGMVRE